MNTEGGVVIRPAALSDLDALLKLYVDLSADNASTDRDRAAPALQQLIAAEHVHLLIAERGGEPLGTVMLVVLPGLTHGARNWAQLENMVVREAARGTGVGRALLDACAAIAREHGCYKIQLQSARHRDGAHAFYERFGFEDTSRGYRLYLT